MNNVGNCKSCGKTIVWMKTVQGKNMPVDMTEHALEDAQAGELFNHEEHVSHFSTCPAADKHREARK